MNLDEHEMLTLSEAAQILGIYKGTLRNWANQGLINTYRFGQGQHRRFKLSEVLALIEQAGNNHNN